jgi:hypothetical protein
MNNIPLMKNPSIRNSWDYEDRNGLLGKAILTANEVINVFTVSDKSKFVIANINVVNTNANEIEFTLWVSEDKTPSLIDIIEYKVKLEPYATFVRTLFIMDKLESIFAQSDSNDVIIRIDGYDDRPI